MKWPKNNKPADFSLLAEAVRDAIKQTYRLRRRSTKKDVDWKGPEAPNHLLAVCGEFRDRLTASRLKWEYQDQGRSTIDIIITIAIQLGIEQGRRMLKKELRHLEYCLKNNKDPKRALETLKVITDW